MAYLDAFTSILFRSDAEGRRVLVPYGQSVYLVSDYDAIRIERCLKFYYGASLATIISVQICFGWRWNLLAVPVSVICFYAILIWQSRSLSRLSIKASDLPRLSRSEIMAKQAAATGRGTLWVLLLLGVMMTAAGVFAAIRNPTMWLGAAFFGLCTIAFALQLRRLG